MSYMASIEEHCMSEHRNTMRELSAFVDDVVAERKLASQRTSERADTDTPHSIALPQFYASNESLFNDCDEHGLLERRPRRGILTLRDFDEEGHLFPHINRKLGLPTSGDAMIQHLANPNSVFVALKPMDVSGPEVVVHTPSGQEVRLRRPPKYKDKRPDEQKSDPENPSLFVKKPKYRSKSAFPSN